MKKYTLEQLTSLASKLWLFLNIIISLILTTIAINLISIYSDDNVDKEIILAIWVFSYIFSEVLSLVVAYKLGNKNVFK